MTTAQIELASPGSLVSRGAQSVMATYGRTTLELVSGKGCRVQDATGRAYLDLLAGVAVNALGHGHPAIVKAIRDAAAGLLHVSNLYWTEPMIRLAERLTAASGLERAFFCNSGAEAVEAAIKLARKARPGRGKIVVFERSFHGRTLGALSATCQARYQDAFKPLVPGFLALPYGDIEAVERTVDADTAAVLLEPIQGEGGVRPAPDGFLAAVRKLCTERGALLLLDEVQTGLGRTGTFYAFQGAGVVPDAVASAKALAGGLPMGVLLAGGEAARAFVPGDHASTFGGGPFVATVANAVLDVILADGFLAMVRRRGEQLGCGLAELAKRHPTVVSGVRGKGLMWGLVLHGPQAARLVELLQGLGVLAMAAGPDVLRVIPPLVITAEELDEGLALLDQGLRRLGTAA